MVVRIKELVHEVNTAFKARHLFRNWFDLFISYVISDDYIHVMCRDSSSIYLERVVFGRLVRAYYDDDELVVVTRWIAAPYLVLVNL